MRTRLRYALMLVAAMMLMGTCGMAQEDDNAAEAKALAAAGFGPNGECPKSIAPMIKALGDEGEYGLQVRAYDCLGKSHDPAAARPMVESAVNSHYVQLTGFIVEALRELDAPQTGPLLVAALKDRKTRWSAAMLLGELRLEEGFDPLMEMLHSPDTEMRNTAVGALAAMGNPRATLDLCAALNDPAFNVRMAAASALGALGDRAAVAPLIAMLDSHNESLRDTAANSLGRLRDPRAVEPLIAALEDENRRMAEAAAQALGAIGDERAAAPLLRMYHNANDGLRATLVGALANLDTPEVDKFLKATLKSKRNDLVVQARMYFIRHGDDEALPKLVAALNDSSGWILARDYLRSGNPTLVEAVRQWAADNDVDVDSLRGDDGEAVAWGSQP